METGLNFSSEVRRIIANVEASNPDIVAGVRLRMAWEKAVDANVLAHTDAVYLIPDTDGSDVIIYVDTNIWATELNLQSELLRLKMNLALKEMDEQEGRYRPIAADGMFALDDVEQVKRLRFMTSKERYRGHRADPPSTVEQLREEVRPVAAQPVPLSDDELDEITRQVSVIENPQLRQAAYDAMVADAELKKGMGR